MALPDILAGLLQPAAYPHSCSGIRLIETHISWVLLTGDYAYKIKKPVRLPFVDFSTLDRRRFFCDEELRCNRRFAPELYLDVVPVCRAVTGAATLGGTGEILDWAVCMRQFAPDQGLDRLIEVDALATGVMREFGVALATVHASLPQRTGSGIEIDQRIIGPVRDNFDVISGLEVCADERRALERVRHAAGRLTDELLERLATRLADGHVRECHGDLHLANLVLLDGRVVAFDCLEFDANLRWIDVMSDVAFLFMDCLVRGHSELAYVFLDGYLDTSGDYAGVALLPFYAAYRAMVRAKVAGIQREQQRADPATDPGSVASLTARLAAHLDWTREWLERPAGGVVLMCGVSGSGKSWLAERLVGCLPAVRLRSDVARRMVVDGPVPVEYPERPPVSADRSGAPIEGRSAGSVHVDTGRYAPERVAAVYALLGGLLDDIVPRGETVILDATFITRQARQPILTHAREAGWPVLILHCTAPRAVLEARVRQRLQNGHDASEADLAVLARQLERAERFAPDEPVLEVDTGQAFDLLRLQDLCAAVRRHLRSTASR